MATLSNMITNIKQNLGNRSSGVIGGTAVDTVVLGGINKGFKNIIKIANPTYYDRLAQLTLIVGQVDYPEPTVDLEGRTIKIKQIYKARLNLSGETAIYHTSQITINEYLQWRVPSTTETGIPSTYCYHNRTFKFTRYPDTTYIFTMGCNIQPADFTFNQLNDTLNIDDIWIDTIEAFATFYCFDKLQLTRDALRWEENYLNSKRENKAVINKQPGMKQPYMSGYRASDPLYDPFVRSFNS